MNTKTLEERIADAVEQIKPYAVGMRVVVSCTHYFGFLMCNEPSFYASVQDENHKTIASSAGKDLGAVIAQCIEGSSAYTPAARIKALQAEIAKLEAQSAAK